LQQTSPKRRSISSTSSSSIRTTTRVNPITLSFGSQGNGPTHALRCPHRYSAGRQRAGARWSLRLTWLRRHSISSTSSTSIRTTTRVNPITLSFGSQGNGQKRAHRCPPRYSAGRQRAGARWSLRLTSPRRHSPSTTSAWSSTRGASSSRSTTRSTPPPSSSRRECLVVVE